MAIKVLQVEGLDEAGQAQLDSQKQAARAHDEAKLPSDGRLCRDISSGPRASGVNGLGELLMLLETV